MKTTEFNLQELDAKVKSLIPDFNNEPYLLFQEYGLITADNHYQFDNPYTCTTRAIDQYIITTDSSLRNTIMPDGYNHFLYPAIHGRALTFTVHLYESLADCLFDAQRTFDKLPDITKATFKDILHLVPPILESLTIASKRYALNPMPIQQACLDYIAQYPDYYDTHSMDYITILKAIRNNRWNEYSVYYNFMLL